MKTLILILFLLSSTSLFSQNKWEEIANLAGDAPHILCIDTNTCFIITSIGGSNWLHKSNDKGASWIMLKGELRFKDFNWAKYISAPDSTNIYIGSTSKGNIYRSNDGGSTFEKLKIDSVVQIKSIAMLNKDIGIISDYKLWITADGWLTHKVLYNPFEKILPEYTNLRFLNDSTAVMFLRDLRSEIQSDLYLFKLNIRTFEYEYYFIDLLEKSSLDDISIVNENLYYACGKKFTIPGGSGNDAVYKTTDGGKTWRNLLDIHINHGTFGGLVEKEMPFGVQSISFKDSLTGIAVGQGGKIVYTYDGGESWIYEEVLPDSLSKRSPPTMRVRYAGFMPIICDYGGIVYRLKEDHLAPKPTDTITICGRIMLGDKGQGKIPVIIGTRVTMTDSNGYYKFTQLSTGTYKVRAVNKFFDYVDYSYCPYFYSPDGYEVTVTDDTCGLDFTATSNIQYRSLYGNISDTLGNAISGIKVNAIRPQGIVATAFTDELGNYALTGLESHLLHKIKPESDIYTFVDPWHTLQMFWDIDKIDFKAYPPLTGVAESKASAILKYDGTMLYVSPDYCLPDFVITVSDLSGRELLKVHARAELSLASLPRGLYLVSISNKEKVLETVKIITY